MRLSAYCDHLYDLVHSRKGLQVDWLNVKLLEVQRKAIIESRVHFWDDSLLRFHEELIERSFVVIVVDYVYHYQLADGALLFRYDRAPHYREIATFPHHKHVVVDGRETVEPAQPPSLAGVFREIESRLSVSNE